MVHLELERGPTSVKEWGMGHLVLCLYSFGTVVDRVPLVTASWVSVLKLREFRQIERDRQIENMNENCFENWQHWAELPTWKPLEAT